MCTYDKIHFQQCYSCRLSPPQVVKQTVMTVVYGVTFVGGRQQIEVKIILLYVTMNLYMIPTSKMREAHFIMNLSVWK